MNIAGMPIFFSPTVLEATEKRLFPYSRHRSQRITKKLIKRFGGEFVMQPAIYQMGVGMNAKLVAHTSFEAKIRAELSERLDRNLNDAMRFGGLMT